MLRIYSQGACLLMDNNNFLLYTVNVDQSLDNEVELLMALSDSINIEIELCNCFNINQLVKQQISGHNI